MNPRNAGIEIAHPDNEGNYPDNADNLHRLFSEIVFFKYKNRLPEQEYESFVKAVGSHQLPTAFLKLDVHLEKFLDEFGSNYILGMAGTYMQDLKHLCGMLQKA
ncbi:MAG: hypothetical protein GY797_05695 [Deltaproteobacteria bacterium]|nr:hypothetical protein [Deltaproteobacteria bacterium]